MAKHMLGSKPKHKRDRLGEAPSLAASLDVGTPFTCLRSSDPSLQDLNHRQHARMAESKNERESSKTVKRPTQCRSERLPMTRRYFSTEIVSGGCKPTSASFVRSERFSRRTGQFGAAPFSNKDQISNQTGKGGRVFVELMALLGERTVMILSLIHI